MKKWLAWLLAAALLLSCTASLAEDALEITEADTYVDPAEDIIRDVKFDAFSFRGPEGWTQTQDESGALYVISPDGQNTLVVYASNFASTGLDFSNELQRTLLYDALMQQYNGGRYVDVNGARYCEGVVEGIKTIIFLYGVGSDILVVAYVNESGEQPAVSDLSPYTKTVIHE